VKTGRPVWFDIGPGIVEWPFYELKQNRRTKRPGIHRYQFVTLEEWMRHGDAKCHTLERNRGYYAQLKADPEAYKRKADRATEQRKDPVQRAIYNARNNLRRRRIRAEARRAKAQSEIK
jgi:hypothetical protein